DAARDAGHAHAVERLRDRAVVERVGGGAALPPARGAAYSDVSIVGLGLIIAPPSMTGGALSLVRSHTRPTPPPEPPALVLLPPRVAPAAPAAPLPPSPPFDEERKPPAPA